MFFPSRVTLRLATNNLRNHCYDADGPLLCILRPRHSHILVLHNLTSDNAGLAVQYDHDNLPIKTVRGAATINLYYGPDNQHTREVGSDGTKVYLDGGYEDWISQGSTKVYVGTEAEITTTSSGRTVNYLLTDRLGSVGAIASSAGTLVEARGSDAFGKPRTGMWADTSPAQLQSTAITAKGFTEHEHLNSVQLIHMNGRVYDYQLGRFLSVDPFIQSPLNSQSLNPYSYILNNPLAGTDPTGYCAEGEEAATGTHICGGSGGPTVEGDTTMAGGTAGSGYTIQMVDHSATGQQAPNGAQGQSTTTQGTTAQATPSATPNPSWCPNCQFKSDPSAQLGGAPQDDNSNPQSESGDEYRKNTREFWINAPIAKNGIKSDDQVSSAGRNANQKITRVLNLEASDAQRTFAKSIARPTARVQGDINPSDAPNEFILDLSGGKQNQVDIRTVSGIRSPQGVIRNIDQSTEWNIHWHWVGQSRTPDAGDDSFAKTGRPSFVVTPMSTSNSCCSIWEVGVRNGTPVYRDVTGDAPGPWLNRDGWK